MEVKKIKLGLDVHGVIDRYPDVWSAITTALLDAGHEVHIITGQELSDELIEQLAGWGIAYSHLFSITTWHKNQGTEIRYKDKNNPFIDYDLWDRTKAEYCMREQIDFHVDDSDVYHKFFMATAYLQFRSRRTT